MDNLMRIRAVFRVSVFLLLAAGLWACQAHRPAPPPPHPGPDATVPTTPDPADKPPTQRSYEVFGQRYHPIDCADGFQETGIASWYGHPFHGRPTSSGETYDMHAMTAAHRVLPMGTFLLVRNLENDREIIVRINDRGPFARNRILDLSYRSAKEIDMIRDGTTKVEIRSIDPNTPDIAKRVEAAHPDYFTGDFTVQVGAYSDKSRAEAEAEKLRNAGKDSYISSTYVNGQSFHRVRVGRFASMADAEQLKIHLAQNGYENVFAVRAGK